jgi:hypothetical protein
MDRLNEDRLWAFGRSFSNDQMNPPGGRLVDVCLPHQRTFVAWLASFAPKAEVAKRKKPKNDGF